MWQRYSALQWNLVFFYWSYFNQDVCYLVKCCMRFFSTPPAHRSSSLCENGEHPAANKPNKSAILKRDRSHLHFKCFLHILALHRTPTTRSGDIPKTRRDRRGNFRTSGTDRWLIKTDSDTNYCSDLSLIAN